MMDEFLEDSLLSLEVDGYCIVNGVMSEDEAAAILESVTRTLASDRYLSSGGGSTFINFDQSFVSHLTHPRILGLAERLFGPVGTHTRIAATSPNIQLPSGECGGSGTLGDPEGFHADWPWSQGGSNRPTAAHAPASSTHATGMTMQAPLPDVLIDLQTFFLLTDFTAANGGTHVCPGTHRLNNNPNSKLRKFTMPRQTERQIVAKAGSVLCFDNRLWHKAGKNYSDAPRAFLGVKYVPAWLNLHIRRPDSVEHRIQLESTGEVWGHWPYVDSEVYDRLPRTVQPLFRHWVAREWVMSTADSRRAIYEPQPQPRL